MSSNRANWYTSRDGLTESREHVQSTEETKANLLSVLLTEQARHAEIKTHPKIKKIIKR